MAREKDFTWEDDLMTKSFQRQESHLKRLSLTHGKDYGKPKAGSDSEKRSLAYKANVMNEVANICYQISMFGEKSTDGKEYIRFGELFKVNEKISNKCVGILQRARKHRLLHFSEETLWQGKDDNVVITLLRKNRDIQVYFTHTKQLLPNEENGNICFDIKSPRRAHFNWVTNVEEVEKGTLIYHAQLNMPEMDELCEVYEECLSFAVRDDKVEAFAMEAAYLENSFLLKECIIICSHKDEIIDMAESKEVKELDEKLPDPCELNLITESRVFMKGQSFIPQLVNFVEENVIDVTSEAATNFDKFTCKCEKSKITCTANLHQVSWLCQMILNSPVESSETFILENVEKMDKFQPEVENLSSKLCNSSATLSVFTRYVYTSDCPPEPTKRTPVEISIPALPQYRRSLRTQQQNELQETIVPRTSTQLSAPPSTDNLQLNRSQTKTKEFKLTFNKCTTLYNPPKPVYEDIKRFK